MGRLPVHDVNLYNTQLVDQFQREACTVMDEPWFKALSRDAQMAFLYIGLGQEAGEAQEVYKKAIPFQRERDKEKIAEELGDNLWHIATVAAIEGISLADVMRKSMLKFRKRYPHRFEEVLTDESKSD